MLFAYLAGSVNLTIAATRLLHIDGLREAGSQNPGVTNLFRVAGARTAAAVLILELAKAYIAFLPARILGDASSVYIFILPFLIGNLFPVFYRFRGGKGVAAAVGAFLVFIALFALFRRVSAGSLGMALSWPALIWLFHGQGGFFYTGAAVTLILFATHRANILRLVFGTEPKLEIHR